jgi:hypothetical protein
MNESEPKKNVKCPKCGAELSEDTISRLLKKEQKELGFLLLGVVFGAVLGIVGNLWVSFLIEAAKSYVASSLWPIVSIIGVIVTTILSVYVLLRVVKYAARLILGGESQTILKSRKEEE